MIAKAKRAIRASAVAALLVVLMTLGMAVFMPNSVIGKAAVTVIGSTITLDKADNFNPGDTIFSKEVTTANLHSLPEEQRALYSAAVDFARKNGGYYSLKLSDAIIEVTIKESVIYMRVTAT
ncbi:MAG: hypothetical protein RSC68_00265 [Acinetobacter sp.]